VAQRRRPAAQPLLEDRDALAHASRMPCAKRRIGLLASLAVLGASFAPPQPANAFGDDGVVDLRALEYGGGTAPRPTAMRRLAWEVRERTSVETRLEPTRVRLDAPELFATPFLYWAGDREFPPLSTAEVTGLRRFVEFGGFVLVDDAAPEAGGFDASIRRELARAFGDGALRPLPEAHTVYRSFYLLRRPTGRVRDPGHLEAISRGSRAAVVYSRHDLGGAWDRDELGRWVVPALDADPRQREEAYRLGVNLVLYALCLDYKDDQVHAPFIMRRQSVAP
jgi:hypothetical protein